MNKVYLIGNLTRDPEASTAGSVSMCRFSIAVSRRYAGKDGNRETDFFNIVTWRGTADNCAKFLQKGNKVAVVGSIQNRTYEVDGVKRYATDIIAEEVEFLSPKNSIQSEGEFDSKPSRPAIADLQPVEDGGDLPF